MKKIIAIALVLAAMLAVCAIAYADGELSLVEDVQYVYADKDNKYNIYVYAIYENVSEQVIDIKNGELSITDAEGNVFGDPIKLYTSYIHPYCLQPGEKTYVRYEYSVKDVPEQSKITDHTLTFVTAPGRNIWTPIQVEPTMEVTSNSKGDAYYLNNYAKIVHYLPGEMTGPQLISIIRDQDAKLLSIIFGSEGNLTLYTGMPVKVRTSGVSSYLTNVWINQNSVPTTIETLGFFY